MNNTTPCQSSRRFSLAHVGRVSLAALAAVLLSSPPAAAQLARIGVNPDTGAAPVRGTDTAFDPVNNVYLVVGATAGNSFTPLFGVFVNPQGAPVTSPFQINNPNAHAHFPRAVYSPHVSNGAGGFGGFLVTWHGGLFTNSVRSRVVAYPGTLVTPESEIPSQTFQEAGASAAYGPSAQMFLMAWQASDFSVWAARIGTNGQTIGSAFMVSAGGIGARDPSVAWNPNTNEFGVLYTGFSLSGATTTFARINTSGSVVRRNTFNITSGTYITDLTFNPVTGRYLGAWFQGGTFGAEIDGNGDVVATGLLSTVTGTRDGLGLSYNSVTGTTLLVGMGPSFNIWAAELNSRGARTGSDTEVTSAGGPLGSYHPRTTSHTGAPDWNISFYHNFGTMRDQVVRTNSSGGGPSGSLGSAPAPSGGGDGGTSGGSGGCTTASPGSGWTCVNGGWLPPSGGGGTTSGGCTSASPGSGWTCVNGGWVPPTSGGGSSSGGCATADPFQAIGGGTCVNGGWVPGGGGGGTTSGGCTTSSPGSGWTCVNGGWVPPTTTSGGGTSGGCVGSDPFAAIGGGSCINGGWVPGGSGGSGSTSGCSTSSPGSGWTCVNGGWLPPGSGGVSGSSSGSCATASPGSGWTCVNGGWLPPGSGGSTSGGCSTPDPFAAIGGGTCVNGGWIPGGSSGGGTSTCSTPDPFAAIGGGTCVNGGWTFGSSSSSSTCSTPDPFVAMGGGSCINGGWIPRR